MPRYLYSSTLWYSGVFAAAATFDAARKERRKEQWDRVIAEVRQELGLLNSQEEERAVEIQRELGHDVQAHESITNIVDEVNAEDSLDDYQPFGHLHEDGSVLAATENVVERGVSSPDGEDEDIFHLVDPERSRPQNPVNTGPDLQEWNLAPQSIYAPESAKRKAERTRWTPKKLATVQKCTEILQLQIINALQRYKWEEEAAAAVPDDYGKYIRQLPEISHRELEIKFAELLEIKAADAYLSDYHPKLPDRSETLCQYTQDSLGQFHDTVRAMNSSLRHLFKQRRQEEISQAALLARIAYTLHLSPAPPNVNTFNTLLIGLIGAQEKRLARAVIATMCEAHVRTNEVSFVTEADYHVQNNDVAYFVKAIERLRGKHGGQMLARPDLKIMNDARSKRLLKVDVEGRNGGETKIIQLPMPTPMVFGAIVGGVLKFAGFEAALSICEGMGREGWGLCMAGMTPLLKDCAERGNWTSGLAIWHQIQALKTKSSQGRYVREKVPIDAFAAMLRLCSKCDQRDVFDKIWSQATATWERSLDRLVKLVKGESDANDDVRSNHRTARNSRSWPSVQDATTRGDVNLDNANTDADATIWQQRNSSSVNEDSHASQEPSLDQEAKSFLPSAALNTRSRDTKRQAELSPSPTQVTVLDEQQLLGIQPATYELDDYEVRERPMSVGA